MPSPSMVFFKEVNIRFNKIDSVYEKGNNCIAQRFFALSTMPVTMLSLDQINNKPTKVNIRKQKGNNTFF